MKRAISLSLIGNASCADTICIEPLSAFVRRSNNNPASSVDARERELHCVQVRAIRRRIRKLPLAKLYPLAGLAGAIVLSVTARAGMLTTLYSFNTPNAGYYQALVYHGGELYGAADGWENTNGDVFKVNATTGAYRVIYSFEGGNDGAAPENGIIYRAGKLYGTTTGGGGQVCVQNGQDYGCGTIFSVDLASKVETKLYAFPPNALNYFPFPLGLTYLNGTLYGTAGEGGVNGSGSVFSFNLSNSAFATLYSFGGVEGQGPTAQLLYENGLFYGTTEGGGVTCERNTGCGVIYSINPATSAESTVFAFAKKKEGVFPFSNLVYHAGLFMGSTLFGGQKGCRHGCGLTYAVTSGTGKESVLSFNNDYSQSPSGVTMQGGNLYETLENEGGNGELVEVDLKTGQQTVLYIFTGGADGSNPAAPLTYHDGVFYGTTNGSNGYGTVFKYVP